MIIKDSKNVEINCPKAKAKAAARSLDAHWYGWNYQYLPDEEVLVFLDVEPGCEEMLEYYENVLVNGQYGFRSIDDYKDGIFLQEVVA